jgi:hypothetical protein
MRGPGDPISALDVSFETRCFRIALHTKDPVARGGWNFRE